MRIRELRERRGLTLTQLANAMEVDIAAAVRWESGKRNPRADKLPRLAEVLGCTIDELYRAPAGAGGEEAAS